MRIKNAVVVITGSASGIGRATALHFARRKACLVLASRRGEALESLVAECESLGARAIAVPTDVTAADAVQALANRAVAHFGRLDVWVNNAAVSYFSPFLKVPLEDFRRVMDVNVMGYVYGARAALERMEQQRSGVLINVASIVGEVPQPYTTAYSMSKAAIRALGVSLRSELHLGKRKRIHVCTVLPATIDTPFFDHAANYTGRRAVAMPPRLQSGPGRRGYLRPCGEAPPRGGRGADRTFDGAPAPADAGTDRNHDGRAGGEHAPLQEGGRLGFDRKFVHTLPRSGQRHRHRRLGRQAAHRTARRHRGRAPRHRERGAAPTRTTSPQRPVVPGSLIGTGSLVGTGEQASHREGLRADFTGGELGGLPSHSSRGSVNIVPYPRSRVMPIPGKSMSRSSMGQSRGFGIGFCAGQWIYRCSRHLG